MENYLWGKKLIFEWTGYKHDLKEYNPNFGKKKTFRKSQMRTLLIFVGAPIVLFIGALVSIAVFLLMTCFQKMFCRSLALQIPGHADSLMKLANETRDQRNQGL